MLKNLMKFYVSVDEIRVWKLDVEKIDINTPVDPVDQNKINLNDDSIIYL